MSLVEDLVEHTNIKRREQIKRCIQLLEDGDDILAFLVGAVASDVGSLVMALREQTEAFPIFARLPPQMQTVAVTTLISSIVNPVSIALNAQNASDLLAATREIAPATKIIVREPNRG